MTTTTAPKMTAAGTALMTAIGNWTGSFFDGGIVAGEGIWHDNLTGEAAGAPGVPATPKGVAGVIRRLAETGYLDISDNGEDGVWVSLTALGAATATALGTASAPEPTQTPKKASTKHATKKAAVKAAESAQADVAFYRQRKSGTLRRLPYLAPGTPERKAAEKVAAQVDKGTPVAVIAEASGRSLSTVRRLLAAVDLAREVESGKYAKAMKTGKVILPAKGETK
jgi:hypothetical protein